MSGTSDLPQDFSPNSGAGRTSADLARLTERVTRLEQQLADCLARLETVAPATPRVVLREGHLLPPLTAAQAPAPAAEEPLEVSLVEPYELTPPKSAPAAVVATGAASSGAKLGSPFAGAGGTSRAAAPPATEFAPRATQKKRAAVDTRQSGNLEALIGGRLLTWLGGLILVIAVGFTVHWWWKTFSVPPAVRVAGLHLLGAGILAAAHLAHRQWKLPIMAKALAGLGLFTLYATAYAALRLFHLWSEPIAFAECAAITALAVVIALRSNSIGVILLGALGGYLTPFLTSSEAGSHVALFGYLGFLNVALLVTAVWRRWDILKPITYLATAAVFGIWLSEGYDPAVHRWSTFWLGTMHTLIAWAAVLGPTLVLRRPSNVWDLATKSASAMGFLGLSWALFHDSAEQQLAMLAWGLALGELGLFALTARRLGLDDRLPRVVLGLSAVFFTLAIPLQLDDPSYLGIAWCIEGTVFTLLAVFFSDVQLRLSAVAMFALGAARLLAWDYQPLSEHLYDLPAARHALALVGTGALLILAAGTMHWTIPRRNPPSPRDQQWGALISQGLMAAGNLLGLIALSTYWSDRTLLVLWTLDAALVWGLAFWANSAATRWYAALIAVGFAGVLAVQLGDRLESPFVLLANPRFGSLALLAGTYLLAGWGYRRLTLAPPTVAAPAFESPHDQQHVDPLLATGESWHDALLAILGHLVLGVALTMEVGGWYQRAAANGATPFADMQMARLATYSILWAVYAALLVAAGFVLRYPAYRLLGLAGFLPILAKVFFIDLASLDLLPRVLAFAVLGLMLLGTSMLYQRYAARLETES